jgi:methionyl-tRNA synthetase
VGEGGVKMSKSLGNVVEPRAMIAAVGADSLRFYLARTMRGGDATISPALVATVHNTQLANSVGNLYARAIKLYKKNLGASVLAPPELAPEDAAVRAWVVDRATAALADLDLEGVADLAAAIVEIADRLNQHFGDAAPWALAKDPAQRPRLESVMYATLDSLRLLFELAHPILPVTARRALANLGLPPIPDEPRAHAFAAGGLPAGAALGDDDHLFPRVEAP